ncbi:PA14 domain protein (fragment) [Verrucomicrobia bacterium]
MVLLIGWSSLARADVAVLTQHNNPARTGANLEEKVLNTSNVNVNSFGLLFTRPVDDQIHGQPLLVPRVELPSSGAHDLVIVATANDSVYAFDAHDPAATAPYWHVSFLGPDVIAPRASDMKGACGGEYADFSGNIGIIGTPVIDPASFTVFLVARTLEHGTNFVQRLHALDLRTGAERPNSPVVITATFPGHGSGNVNGQIMFDPQRQNQRTGLALVKGIVYIGWSSHCDWGPYHGWLLGYEASSLRQAVIYNTTPEGANGGIWMSGAAPAWDEEGDLYLGVGNGSVGTGADPSDVINRGESFLRLRPAGNSMQVVSWFTPQNWQYLENTDNDFGNAGPLLIPGTKLAMAGDKEGRVFLVERDHMGGLSRTNTDTNIVQSFQVSSPGSSFGLYGSAVWWDGPGGSFAYLWCKEDYLRQYAFDRTKGRFQLPEAFRHPAKAKVPGGILSISADGHKAGSGIVWVTYAAQGDPNHQVTPGIFMACDAQNVAHELWNSEQAGARDSLGNFSKFAPPTVANGRVYVATFSNRLNVYGLLRGR